MGGGKGGTHNGVKASESCTDGETSEARLGDGAVNNTFLAEAVEKAFCDFVAVDMYSQHPFSVPLQSPPPDST